ncbi:MAG: 5'-methylthioadenosine/adenosylhomocysteine nucleosidase [Synechococcales cyanobacterium]
MIGILGALDEEVAVLQEGLSAMTTQTYLGRSFYAGHMDDQEVVVVKSGIGKVRAAITATALVSHFGVQGLIFTGVAAALEDHLGLGDVVLLHRGIEHDFGMVDERGFRLGLDFIPGEEAKILEADPAYFQVATGLPLPLREIVPGIPTQIHSGVVATGDLFVADRATRTAIQARTQANVVEMEGAAVLRVAIEAGIPCLLVRSISDSGDNTLDFLSFFARAAQNSGIVVRSLLKALT